MSAFVLDNSVAMRWLLSSKKRTDQVYAERVLGTLGECGALTPNFMAP